MATDNNTSRLVGVDPAPTVQMPQVGRGVRQPNLQVANSIWNRTAETNVQATQAKEREAMAQGQQRLAEQQREIMEAESRQRGSALENMFSGVVAGLQTFQEIKSAREAAEREKRELQGEQEFADMLAEGADIIAQSEIELRDMAEEEGALVIQRRLLDMGANPNLTPEQRQQWNRWVFTSTEDIRRNHNERLQRERRDLQASRIEDIRAQAATDLGEITANLHGNIDATESSSVVAEAFEYIDGVVNSTEGLGLAEKYQLRADLMDSIRGQIVDNARAQQMIENGMEETQAFADSVRVWQQMVAEGQMTQTQFDEAIAMARPALPNASHYNPQSVNDILEDRLAFERNMDALQEQRTPEAGVLNRVLMGNAIMDVANGTDPARFGRYEDDVRALWTRVQDVDRQKTTLQRRIDDTQSRIAQATREFATLRPDIEMVRGIQDGSINFDELTPQQQRRVSNLDAQGLLEEARELQLTIEQGRRAVARDEQELGQHVQMLMQYGLQNGLGNTDYFDQWLDEGNRRDQLNAATQQIAEREAQNQDFTQGARGAVRPPAPLATVDAVQGSNPIPMERWANVYTPFQAGQRVVVTSGQGMRWGRSHPAIDFGAPEGTPIVAPRSGVVTRNFWDDGGGGNVISVQHADGTESSYLHLQARSDLAVGTRVSQGQPIGAVGNTGRSDGAHLDLRVKDRPGGSWIGDVHGWLAETPLEQSPQSRYSVASPGLTDNSNVAANHRQDGGGVITPSHSFQLPDGFRIEDGMLYSPIGVAVPLGQGNALPSRVQGWEPEGRPAAQRFNSANPVRGAMMSNQRGAYEERNDPSRNYGYQFFADNPHAARKLAEVANNVGIPAVWLADVMSFESGFDTRASNDEGAVGLIQFYPGGGLAEVAQSMGVSQSEASRRLLGMSFVEQMDYVEDYLLGYTYGRDTQFRGQYDTVDRLLTAVFRGKPAAFGSNYESIVNDSDSNGMTVGRYTQTLGNAVGRRYYTIYDRMTGTRIHDSYRAGCPTCESMQYSGQVVAHVVP